MTPRDPFSRDPTNRRPHPPHHPSHTHTTQPHPHPSTLTHIHTHPHPHPPILIHIHTPSPTSAHPHPHPHLLVNNHTSSGFYLSASEALAAAGPRSLLLMDELGRGTSTYDGAAIACATLQHVATVTQSLCIFTTHHPLVHITTTTTCPTPL